MIVYINVLGSVVINLFLKNDIKNSLSVKTGISLNIILKSFPSLNSQVPSTELKEPAISSASIIEQETIFCFLEDHHIGALLYA